MNSREDKPREYILRFAKTLRESGNEFAAEGIENAVAELTRSSWPPPLPHYQHLFDMIYARLQRNEVESDASLARKICKDIISALPECAPSADAHAELLEIHQAVMDPQSVVVNESDTYTVKLVKAFVLKAVGSASTDADRRLAVLIDAVQYAVNRLDHDPRGPQQVQVSGDLAVALAFARSATAASAEDRRRP